MPKNPKYYHPQTDFYRKYQMDAPETIAHGTEEDISKKMKRLKPNTWRLEGNKLIGETEMGPLVNIIPTDYILTGTDDDGMPVFKRIDI